MNLLSEIEMPRYIKLFIPALACLLVISCNRLQLSLNILNFRKSEIDFPDSMLTVIGNNMWSINIIIDRPLLVIYYDSLSCSSCKTGHLIEFEQLFVESEEDDKFDIAVIFSPKQSEFENTLENIKLSGFNHPVILDANNEFAKLNKVIPEDIRFHTFLINKERHPVFVGNPIHGSKSRKLFDQTLNDIDASLPSKEINS